MRLYEIQAPGNRTFRLERDDSSPPLIEGYSVIGEVFGADQYGAGGFVEPIERIGKGRSLADYIRQVAAESREGEVPWKV